MKLILCTLPDTLRGPDDETYRGHVPKRARKFAPDAAMALLKLVEATHNGLVFTDVFRSADASLAAKRSKRGIQPPSFSAHNYGLAFDLDLTETLLRLRLRYPDLRELLGHYGFHCHRRDLESAEPEAWHFNHLGEAGPAEIYLSLAEYRDRHSWALPIEEVIRERYGHAFILDIAEVQTGLQKLRLYSGAIDGTVGPLTRGAIARFQRTWDLPADGIAGKVTQRTLAYVTAEEEIIAMPDTATS